MPKKIIVYHSYYGCDTGCCGHSIEIDDRRIGFNFDHPDSSDNPVEWAKQVLIRELGEEHLKDLDWENCVICNNEDCKFR